MDIGDDEERLRLHLLLIKEHLMSKEKREHCRNRRKKKTKDQLMKVDKAGKQAKNKTRKHTRKRILLFQQQSIKVNVINQTVVDTHVKTKKSLNSISSRGSEMTF